MGKTSGAQARNVVTTDDKGVIVSVLHGKQTKASVRALSAELIKRMNAQHAQGKKVLTLTDIRSLKITDSSSEARLASKEMLALQSDASAVVGNRGIIGLTMHMVRLTKAGSMTRFFTSERKARAWLEHVDRPGRPRVSVSLVAGIFVGLIGLLALLGWQINNPYLMGGLPTLRPMNPLAAVGLLATGYGFICYWNGQLKQLKIAGIFGASLGLAALLPIDIDYLLFADKVRAVGTHGQLADSAALCFIAVGLSPFTVGTKKLAVRLLQYALGIAIIGLSLFNIFGQLYAHDFIYGLSGSFVMAINLAMAFLAVGLTLVLLVLYKRGGDVLGGITRTGWLVVAALLFVQVATYAAWSQTIMQNKANVAETFLRRSNDLNAGLDERIAAYVNGLYGFKGLFASSDYVNQGEFQSYYNSLNLSTAYPGLRNLSFVSKVQEKDLAAFVARNRADSSLHSNGNPGFAITAKSNSNTHYITTYAAASNTVGGVDLASNPSRMTAFQKADESRKPVSSGTVDFAATNTQSAQRGFFITLPVPNKASGGEPVGFVNAVFNYRDFFANAFKPETRLDGLEVSITDAADGSMVYRSGSEDIAKESELSRVLSLPIADHTWSIHMSAVASSTDENSSMLSPSVLVIGQLFSLLLAVIFVLQARARRQGFVLAESITEDLEHERNQAVADDQKSNAILSSIGDAVFAVDNDRRITLFNPSAQHISGLSEAEALGKRYDEVLKFEYEKAGHKGSHFIQDALEGRLTAMPGGTVLIHKNGRRIPVADSAAPISDASHKIQGAIIVFRDVTKDNELDKAKSEFVSLASHQLRTPLSAINWYGEMLLNGDAGKLNRDQHEYIQEIFEGNQRMVELVNSLLDVSRLELGKLQNQPAVNDISELINSLEKELTPSIKDKQLTFTKLVHAIPPVVADPKQLRMIVQNLLSNAVKYTPAKGSVTVTLRKATATDLAEAKLTSAMPHWYFSVQDNGYGIPEEEKAKIFGKLFRADNVRKLDVEGTGLGLYIVKEVVQKMGGRVWFTSIESAGTTFYVILPFRSRHTK
jgi:PAS domain S-box-containing protein